jgi:AraC-like DNA-binding protein/ActR/RegA family two-component response regulator
VYRALFVDDEPLITEGLGNIIEWSAYGVLPVATALDGAEALRALHDLRVDILVTDIRMPVMDGLTLLREIRREGSDTRVIILSGYDDFEYVREAAVLGIENYLLKPLDRRELEKTVISTVARLEDPTNRRDLVEQGLDVIRNNLLLGAFFGTIAEAQLREKMEVLRMSPLSPGYTVGEVRPTEGGDGFARALASASSATLQPDRPPGPPCYAVVPPRADKLMVLLYGQGEPQDRAAAGRTMGCVRQRVERVTGARCGAYLGVEVPTFAEIAYGCRTAEDLQPGVLDGSEAMVDWNEQNLLAHPVRHPLVQQTVRYVQEHPEKAMSLKTLAYEFGASPAYLGRLFTSETGRTFTDYLKEHRLRIAALLIRNTRYKMREIARLSGFSDPQYFNRTFKQHTGCTPVEYRRTP